MVEGKPGILEIRERATAPLSEVVEAVAAALRDVLGGEPLRCLLQAIVVSAQRGGLDERSV